MNNTQTSAVPALTIKRTFKIDRARVFAAWTDPSLVSKWFGAPRMTVEDVYCDVRTGGSYRIAMRSEDGEEFIVGGVYSDVRKPERLAFTFRWVEDDPALERDTFVTLDFIERDGDTEMVFTHSGHVDAASRERHEGGWNSAIDQIPAVLGL